MVICAITALKGLARKPGQCRWSWSKQAGKLHPKTSSSSSLTCFSSRSWQKIVMYFCKFTMLLLKSSFYKVYILDSWLLSVGVLLIFTYQLGVCRQHFCCCNTRYFACSFQSWIAVVAYRLIVKALLPQSRVKNMRWISFTYVVTYLPVTHILTS